MKIAMLAPGSRTLPGASESIFATGFLATRIAEELDRRGHQVVMYAPRGSKVETKLMSFDLDPIFTKYRAEREKASNIYLELLYQYELFMASKVVEESNQYDIIHAHDYRKMIYFTNFSKSPIVYTCHTPPLDDIKTELEKKRLRRFYDKSNFIAISKRQTEIGKKYFNFVGVVHHGIEIDKFSFNDSPLDEILFVGRLVKGKRPDIVIKIGQSLKKPVKIVGSQYPSSEDLKYFREILSPMSKLPSVEFTDFIPYPDIIDYYRCARVFVFPINWEEPFGLVMIEAMACGTPVVAFNRGSVSEIIKDGETGFICPPGDIDAMTKAVKKIYEMSEGRYRKMRQACRKHVEENFTIEKMVDGYEKVYKKIIKNYQRRK